MSTTNLLEQKLNTLIENVFLITVDKIQRRNKQLVFLEDIASGGSEYINMELLEMAIFERLMLTNPKDYLIPSNLNNEETDLASETKAIAYLFNCFCRNESALNQNDTVNGDNVNRIRELILRNIATAIKQPMIFESQNLPGQVLDQFKNPNQDPDMVAQFLNAAFREVLRDDETDGYRTMMVFLFPILIEIHTVLKKSSLGSMDTWIVPTLLAFVSDKTNPKLGEVVLDYTTPPEHSDGNRYSESLFGQLLSISIMPKRHDGPYEFYDNLQSVNITTFQNMSGTLWMHLNQLHDGIHSLFKGFLLVGGDAKEKMLKWIGNALAANAPRGQIWNAHAMSGLGALTSAPDSFMIGLTAVLLRLCKPLLRPSLKVFLVDPTYCAVPEDKKVDKGVHMKELTKETCLLPIDENEERLTADKYNFITEVFYMTHKAIDLGYRVCIEKLIRINREMHQIQGAYQDTIAQGGGGADVASNIMQLLTSKTQMFLCLQNLIIEPNNDQLLMQFYEATALWLLQVLHKPDEWYKAERRDKGFAPLTVNELKNLAHNNLAPSILKSVPEYLLENIVGYMTFTHHFDQQQSLKINTEAQSAIFTLILTFMGSAKRVKNPHVRARLAEGLESLLPDSKKLGYSATESLFTQHPHRLYIVENLLNVFVGIEVTGQSVQFEQKFNYRRPMYVIMEFLWTIDEQQQCFKLLEREAVKRIEDSDPPVFLRFVNLLMNDAIFLLDESLNNLQKIRELQAAQDRGDWNSLPETERRQNVENLQQLGMFAKFDNILGRDTIKMLKLLTSETKSIFVHNSMVDRIAAMLNHFLLHLVGPKKANFKVKDKKEFEFDPAQTVLEICQIYVNLQDCDSFCLAVANDGRSYSPELFEFAEQVLVRIMGGNLIIEINEFAQKVARLEELQKENEIALADPPEEFLDPIMSTLMSDPVLLPTSHLNIDRSTITRHLLSDQTDPFNRAPLTMDQVKPNTELKKQIEVWMAERREVYRQKKLNEASNTE